LSESVHVAIATNTHPRRGLIVSIFEGRGQDSDYLAVNPWGAVPAIRLDDGRVLSESNAILWYLSGGTAYRPDGAYDQAKVFQWLSFEADYVQTSVGTLRSGRIPVGDVSLFNRPIRLGRAAMIGW